MLSPAQVPLAQANSNVSLVAFYGEKPSLLNLLIKNIQYSLTQLSEFTPYPIKQVHATVLGCEGWQTAAVIISKWFYVNRKEIRHLDYAGWLEYLQSNSFATFEIGFGGYEGDLDYNFLSRNQHPYYRSFQLQKINDITYVPVLIGWPQKKDLITLELDQLRRKAQKFNFLHKYYKENQSIDNDCYLRLGTINSCLSTEIIATVEHQIREILRTETPIKLSFGQNNLAFAQYQDLSLSLTRTKAIPLGEMTKEQFRKFYGNSQVNQ